MVENRFQRRGKVVGENTCRYSVGTSASIWRLRMNFGNMRL